MFQKGLFIDEPKVNLEMRRQGMVKPPEWDYEWYPSDGLPRSNGFASDVTGRETLNTNSVSLYAKNTTHIYYEYPTTFSKGAMEVELYMVANAIFYLSFGNSSFGIGVRINTTSYTSSNLVYLGTETSTPLTNIPVETRCKVRIVLNDTKGSVYFNDVLCANNVDVTALSDCPDVSIRYTGNSGGNRTSYLYAIRMKFNRT